jgi:oligopeptide transport system permease protein
MLSEGQDKMNQHFHLILFPAIFISILMLSFNLISNGLRDAFNPSLRGVEE